MTTGAAHQNGDTLFVGIDVGSVSVKTALVDSRGALRGDRYLRHRGHPLSAMETMLRDLLREHPLGRIRAFAATGSGGKLACEIIGAEFVNEIIAQARAAAGRAACVRTPFTTSVIALANANSSSANASDRRIIVRSPCQPVTAPE